MPSFHHLHTAHDSDDDELLHGNVVWGTLSGPRPMALCWEWAEVRLGVIVICNPMNVLSNVKLLSEDGQPFTFGQTLLALNTVVHELDWQSKVCDELSYRRVGAKSVIPMAPRARRAGVSHRHASSMMGAQALAA